MALEPLTTFETWLQRHPGGLAQNRQFLNLSEPCSRILQSFGPLRNLVRVQRLTVHWLKDIQRHRRCVAELAKEIQELHVLLWFSTLSQAAFSPCTLPLIGCLRPLESLEDLNIYLLFALASFASTTLLACLISVCTSSRRWDALIRTAYAALQITVPSLSFYSLYLMQCDLFWHLVPKSAAGV